MLRWADQLVSEAKADRQNQKSQQKSKPLRWHFLSGVSAELRADNASHHQDGRENCVDEMTRDRVHDRGQSHGCRCQHGRGPDHHSAWHAQEINQYRHQQKAATDSHNDAHDGDYTADAEDRDDRNIYLRTTEAKFEWKAV